MSACQDIRRELSALLDCELPPGQAAAIEEHMRSCEVCRQQWEALQSVDGQLQRLLTIDDVAKNVVSIEQAAKVQPAASQSARGDGWRWTAIMAAIAASIVLAVVAMRPAEQPQPVKPQVKNAARLVRATGPVEVLSPGSDAWRSIESSPSYEVAQGARLRTGENVLCEVETIDQAKIRLNESAELVMHDARNLELVSGQVWLIASKSGISVDVRWEDEQTQQVATMTCPGESEFQCQVGDSFAACDSVSAQNQQAQWAMGAYSCPVNPGETVSIDAQQNVERKVDGESASKVWQLPLLAVGTSGDPELLSSLNSLLAPIGMTKARHLNEDQIRRLGPKGAVPLLAYVLAESAPDQLRLRRTAIGIAAELADEGAIKLLQELTADPDPYISRTAQAALDKIASEAK
jgi:hypothetical protein